MAAGGARYRCAFMQVLDSTIPTWRTLPTCAGNLGVSADRGTWVITSFAVCDAIALPLTGWFAGASAS